MRLLMIIVLLLLFFFSGMTYGLFESSRSQENEREDSIVDEQMIEEEIMQAEPIATLPETEQSFIHSCAQFLERIITFSYELFVKFLYYIANLFF